MWIRTPLLMTEERPTQGQDVAPGHEFLDHPQPDQAQIRTLHRRIGFKPGRTGRLHNSILTVRRQMQALPRKQRGPLKAQHGVLWNAVKRHAQTISRALPFHRTPEEKLYTPPAQRDRGKYHRFPDMMISQARRGGKARQAKARDTKHRRLMQKVLRYARSSGGAFSGNHNHEVDHKQGVFEMHFGHDDSMAGAYEDHLRRHLPNTIANAFRTERGGHEGAHTHRVEIEHDALWHAVGQHLDGTEEMLRTPLLALLLT